MKRLRRYMLMIEVETFNTAAQLRRVARVYLRYPATPLLGKREDHYFYSRNRILQVQVNAVKPEKAVRKKR